MSDHSHNHDHHHGNADVVMLRRAFVLTTVFMVVELVVAKVVLVEMVDQVLY